MKTLLVIVVIVAVVVGLVFLIRSRMVFTRSATVADIPPIFATLATLKDGSFAVFMFDSPLSRYQTLWFESMLLDALLFVASLVGLRACRISRTSSQSLQPTVPR